MVSILDAEQGNVDGVNHPFFNDGVAYRYDVSNVAGAVLTVSESGSFFDLEQNRVVARKPLTDDVFSGVSEVTIAERLDGFSIYCGAMGKFKGVTCFTSANNSGLKLEYVGPRENQNAYQYRLK